MARAQSNCGSGRLFDFLRSTEQRSGSTGIIRNIDGKIPARIIILRISGYQNAFSESADPSLLIFTLTSLIQFSSFLFYLDFLMLEIIPAEL